MMPLHLLARAWGGAYDPRLVTLLAYGLAALLAARLSDGPAGRLVAAAAVAVNPLIYWQQIFGANDLIVAALLLLACAWALAAPGWPARSVGFACATKQLAWPFAPFLLVHLAGIRDPRELREPEARARLSRVVLVCLGGRGRRWWPRWRPWTRGHSGATSSSTTSGCPAVTKYPLGGTPGFGFANSSSTRGASRACAPTCPLACLP
jgi:hypothetical protein